jgi:hypothetical protein
MNKLIVLIFFIISPECYPQIPEGFPVIDNSDLPDAKFLPSRYFTGESLYGYMNGSAELYREYGITDALITEFDLSSGHYKCEVFKMIGPEEAFGIFSISKFRCPGMPDLADYTCQTKYHLQICKGSYYIRIINKSGTSADSVISLKTGKILAGKIKEPSAELSSFIPDIKPDDLKRNAVLVKGKLGLMNGATDWEDYLKDISGYCTLIFTTREKSIISVRFSNPEDFRQFLNLHGYGTCDLSVSDIRMPGGETIRLLADTHLLVGKVKNK